MFFTSQTLEISPPGRSHPVARSEKVRGSAWLGGLPRLGAATIHRSMGLPCRTAEKRPGGSMGRHIWQFHGVWDWSNEFFHVYSQTRSVWDCRSGLPPRTRPGWLTRGLSGAAVLWQSRGVFVDLPSFQGFD